MASIPICYIYIDLCALQHIGDRPGENVARKGNFSTTLMGHLLARASSNHYSLVRPTITPSASYSLGSCPLPIAIAFP